MKKLFVCYGHNNEIQVVSSLNNNEAKWDCYTQHKFYPEMVVQVT